LDSAGKSAAMSSENEKRAILNRVREALREKTDDHVRSRSLTQSPSLPVIQNADELMARRTDFLPPVGDSLDEKLQLFREISERLKTEFVPLPSIEDAIEHVRHLAEINQWESIGVHDHPLVNPVVESLPLQRLSTDHGFNARDLEKCDAGVSGCEALIAQTASVLVTAKSSGGRALSVLPPHHVVLATSDQLVGAMEEGYQILYDRYAPDRWPSFFSFITGPSRTADVERVLVLGAHGPKKLTVILITG
jgi:L-lactate dehydrogenase complex protein LldG